VNEQATDTNAEAVSLDDLANRTSRHGRVMAVSMMKDEGPYLIEWIAHHIAVGFTDILVYTNDCSDGTDTMLKRMETLGIAKHRENKIPDGIKPQPSALKHAQVEPEVGDADWLLVFDADEFLCIRHGDGTLDPMLDAIKAEGANGMIITWRIFGSGGVVDWSRAPVTEQYLMAAPPMWNKGWGVKTLFQFDPNTWKLGIHRPKMKNKVLDTEFPDTVKWLNGSGRAMEDYFKFRGWRSITRTVGYDWAQMNHYAVKSIDSYAIRRLRGNVNNKKDKYNADYWALQDRNEVRDDTMLRYSDRRAAITHALLSDPELQRLHFAALDRAEAALAEIKAGAAYPGFVADLQTAGAVPITQVSAAPPKKRDAAKIAALMSDVERRASDAQKAERKKPSPDRILQPSDLYVRTSPDVSANVPLEWFANHKIRLPADPRVFTPSALIQIEAGKLQRNLARVLPSLAGGPVLEIGAASGFLGLQIKAAAPAQTVVQSESDPGWANVARWVAEENDMQGAVGLNEAASDPAALVRATSAKTLILGQSGLSMADVSAILGAAEAAARVIVTGRLWVELYSERTNLLAALNAAGFTEPLALDALFALGAAKTP
jgi:methylase of polypeptide subunit release factors